MYKNGSPIDYKEYYARMVTDNLYANKLAYEWRNDIENPVIKGTIATVNTNKQTSSESSNNYSNTNKQTSSESSNNYSNAKSDFTTDLWHSPNVRQQIDTEGAQQGVGNAASGITNRFGR